MAGTSPAMKVQLRLILPNSRDLPAHGRRLPGFDQSGGAEIEIADMGEYPDHRDHGRAKQSNDHDLQMGSAVGAVHRMVHNGLPFLPISRGSRAKGFTHTKQVGTYWG